VMMATRPSRSKRWLVGMTAVARAEGDARSGTVECAAP
jgi:hypothetical protein